MCKTAIFFYYFLWSFLCVIDEVLELRPNPIFLMSSVVVIVWSYVAQLIFRKANVTL